MASSGLSPASATSEFSLTHANNQANQLTSIFLSSSLTLSRSAMEALEREVGGFGESAIQGHHYLGPLDSLRDITTYLSPALKQHNMT